MTRRIGILFAQFAAYHVDRCEAVASALAGRAEVVAVEVAQRSNTYAWEASGEVRGAIKRTLFTGEPFEAIPWPRRLRAELDALADCDTVFVGIGYNEPDVIALAALLRLGGKRVVMMTDSKHDDRTRVRWREWAKGLLFRPFSAALVAGHRQVEYVRGLGFANRPVAIGYDTVDLARVRSEAGDVCAPDGLPFTDRPFVFVGRFVAKKNLPFLLDAYRLYRESAGARARRLVLVGGGGDEAALRARIARLGLDDRIEITGFLDSRGVAAHLAQGVALMLPSSEEQWGLVVNEALALGLPVIASPAVGACDLLVRDGLNGFVVAIDDSSAWAAAMLELAADETRWRAMVDNSRQLAPAGDVARFVEAVELLGGL